MGWQILRSHSSSAIAQTHQTPAHYSIFDEEVMDQNVNKLILHAWLPYVGVFHIRILYPFTHKHTHSHRVGRAKQASPELYANRLHQSPQCVRDCRDKRTKWTLNRSNIHLHLCHTVCLAKTHTHIKQSPTRLI